MVDGLPMMAAEAERSGAIPSQKIILLAGPPGCATVAIATLPWHERGADGIETLTTPLPLALAIRRAEEISQERNLPIANPVAVEREALSKPLE
jgi:hypothetical protein